MKQIASGNHFPVLLLLFVATLAACGGCNPLEFFNGNLGVNVVLPLGLGGNVGILNPDGGDLLPFIPVIIGE